MAYAKFVDTVEQGFLFVPMFSINLVATQRSISKMCAGLWPQKVRGRGSGFVEGDGFVAEGAAKVFHG